MLLQDVWDFCREKVFPLVGRRQKPLFNFYQRFDLEIDRPGADQIRQENLRLYLNSFTGRPAVLVLGEAPGWRGCRFSGVPFTSEAQLASGELPFAGLPSSRALSPYQEATATIFWQVMLPYCPQFLAWNCVPFHPYRPGDLLSNRSLRRQEIGDSLPLLAECVALLAPRLVIAVGKTAQVALNAIDVPSQPLRHPSHGGAKVFKIGAELAFLGEKLDSSTK